MSQPEFKEIVKQVKAHVEGLVDMGISEMSLPETKQIPSEEQLKAIREEIGDCTRCKLCEGRTHIVFGVGNPRATLMFVGEGPGRDEDIQGEPFVGRAGQLLTKMIEAMGLKRQDVYIANIVKCRPPDNRYPEPEEVATCYPFLLKQIAAIHPKVIVGLGNLAVQTLLETKTGITTLRGHFHDFHGFQLMPTYHPAFLLRNPNMKKPCWEDLQQVMQILGLKR
jgi:DNA polymerase